MFGPWSFDVLFTTGPRFSGGYHTWDGVSRFATHKSGMVAHPAPPGAGLFEKKKISKPSERMDGRCSLHGLFSSESTVGGPNDPSEFCGLTYNSKFVGPPGGRLLVKKSRATSSSSSSLFSSESSS